MMTCELQPLDSLTRAMRQRWSRIAWSAVALAWVTGIQAVFASEQPDAYARPVDVAVSEDDRWLVVTNAAGTIALVDRVGGGQVDALTIGGRPVAVVRIRDHQFVVVTREGGNVLRIDVDHDRLVERGRVRLGCEPWAVATTADGSRAFVALAASGQVAAVDAGSLTPQGFIDVGPRPAAVAVSPDDRLVGVMCGSPMQIVLIDATTAQVLSRHPFQGFNPGQLAFSPDGRDLFFTFTYDGGSHPSPGNIRRGWVTGSRLGCLRIATGKLEGLTLDVPGRAVGDVFGLAATPTGQLLISAGGTHEVLCLSAGDLPWTQISGSEVMNRDLARDPTRFTRIDLGGRPLGIALSPDGQRAYVANALLDAVQEVDIAEKKVVRAHALPMPTTPTEAQQVARDGEAIFYDATRSLDQWYSCHTCHYEGGGNTVTFDTRNDGSTGTYKTVLPLWGVARTGPWTWHGWQRDLPTALEKSLVDSMQGPQPSQRDVAALAAFLDTLHAPSSPFREPDGTLSAAAQRGREIFDSSRAGCRSCHAGDDFTSADLHDVGQGRASDVYQGFSPPTLRGLHRKTMFLHSGRVTSLRALLAGPHGPDLVSGLAPFSPQELDDVVAYLESL
jgi:DNA-binding beta-propeller fold protein YncE